MDATMRAGGFQSCLSDPDVWMKPRVNPNGDKYWEYVLCYVDDILLIFHEPQLTMDMLSDSYTLKSGSVKEPDQYLGAKIRKLQIEEYDDPTNISWGMSSDLYFKRAVTEVEREREQIDCYLPTSFTTHLSQGYRPELDVSSDLDAKRANYYQGLIGILLWMCELGRVDIIVPVTLLSRFIATPRVGNLDQAFHIFAYLKRYNKSTLVFDDTVPVFDDSEFTKCDWSEFYPGASEPVPTKAPELRG